ncbi:hypothetical protein [Lacimicrobium alkaliphilum]|uniref:Cobalt transporter n=1 Tax=Lacimicrobium alkaliphilum TaxID=1526571 RepID=A0ABQ1R997_9ALTE|nr:hypothetical protein [Lacimicrobium alkaliphilum]GGD60836.1 hypothetical protein GCM10011357_15180 [Lacimicrobium alkaliphilum]
MAKLKVILLILFMTTQMLGFISSAEASHGVEESAHQFFHEVGQPHSHAEHDSEEYEISYSDDAFEHSNPSHDGSTVFVFDLPISTFPDPQPGSPIGRLNSAWDPPFLYEIPPPPKA